jgi:predicted nucleic acid-binding protein
VTEAYACDTSVLVPALVSWHPGHDAARRAILESVTAIPAHVLLETYSVLTRLPAPHRVSPEDAAAVVAGLRLDPVTLPAAQQRKLVTAASGAGVRGGAVYDALVGTTARHHDLHLLTRDRRARTTYDSIGVRYTLT